MNNLENPRPIENDGEMHLACAVVIDTSGSMKGCEQALLQAIEEMKETIMENDTARGSVELCLITFDDTARIVQPFGSMYQFEPPRYISCDGMTSTHAAIRMAIDECNNRKAFYKANNVSYRQPWIWLFTDGGSNDSDNGSFNELLQMQNDKKLTFNGVGIGNGINAEELKGMHKNHRMLRVSKEDFKSAIEFLSASLVVTSKSKVDEKVTVTVPQQIVIEC